MNKIVGRYKYKIENDGFHYHMILLIGYKLPIEESRDRINGNKF